MAERGDIPPLSLSIAAVERDTGLSKDTLRVWERRYGFPVPARDGTGERAYPLDQVEKLRVIKRLMDAGHRPGRIVPLPIEDLQLLADSGSGSPQRPGELHLAPDLRPYVELIRGHDVDRLRRQLSQAQARLGLGSFVLELLAPLNTLVGDTWMRGHLEIFEEHLYTESVHVVLRQGIASVPQPEAGSARPRVLLTTVPNEPHSLGLLMAEALFLLDGARCVSLGTQTPIWDIVLAATAHRADIVALSFTAAQNPNVVVDGLAELREKLPKSTEIWAGGAAPVLHRRPTPGVQALAALSDIAPELRRWRRTWL
ncbi:MerR family transcriptional regulator [Aquariibacter albus]|uniref:MerR family transcriptional regulator n=1 Tax=Aquariibacter albus TaxID=2759899 RepID=A0A839HI20_9BURK|nr:MerR family transcriptional regulator [Aquariibacter albus]MBB1161905.1 MerR family transcriptional regulator [Aquariibacter albus]